MTTSSSTIPIMETPQVSWAEQPLLLIRKTALSFIQGLFEQADVGHFRWLEDLEETEIIVTDETPIKLDVVGKRPAISVVRAPVAWGQTSLDEMRSTDSRTGAREHTDLLRGMLSINCCSRVDLESEYIAWTVANHLWLLRRIFLKGTPIHEFGRGIQIGSPSPAGVIVSGDKEGEWINTTVTVPYFIQIAGRVTPLNQQVVRAIEAKMNIRGGIQLGRTNVRGQATITDQKLAAAVAAGGPVGPSVGVRPPTMRGRPIREIAFEQSISVKKEL